MPDADPGPPHHADTAAPTTSAKKPRASLAWLAGLLPILVVAGVVVGYIKLVPGGARDPHAEEYATPQPARVVPGHDYYLHVRTLELYPHRPDGKAWDRLDDSAPDPRYDILWQEQVHYPSPTRDNTLLAIWDPITLDVKQALMSGGHIELASTLNQGATINAPTDDPDSTITIRVYDDDAVGSDEAGQITLKVRDLLQGDNVLTFEASDTNAVKRLILRVTDTSQPVANLLDALAAP